VSANKPLSGGAKISYIFQNRKNGGLIRNFMFSVKSWNSPGMAVILSSVFRALLLKIIK